MDTGSGTQTPTASGSGGQGSWRGGGGGPGGRSGRRGGGRGRNSQGERVRSPLPYWLARRKARRPGDKGRRSGGRRFGRFRRDDRAIASSCHLSCSSRTAAGSPTMLLGLVMGWSLLFGLHGPTRHPAAGFRKQGASAVAGLQARSHGYLAAPILLVCGATSVDSSRARNA